MKVVITVKNGWAAQSNSIHPAMPRRVVPGLSAALSAEIANYPSRK